VLVVDDGPELREKTQQMLERNGYDLVVAGDGLPARAISVTTGLRSTACSPTW